MSAATLIGLLLGILGIGLTVYYGHISSTPIDPRIEERVSIPSTSEIRSPAPPPQAVGAQEFIAAAPDYMEAYERAEYAVRGWLESQYRHTIFSHRAVVPGLAMVRRDGTRIGITVELLMVPGFILRRLQESAAASMDALHAGEFDRLLFVVIGDEPITRDEATQMGGKIGPITPVNRVLFGCLASDGTFMPRETVSTQGSMPWEKNHSHVAPQVP